MPNTPLSEQSTPRGEQVLTHRRASSPLALAKHALEESLLEPTPARRITADLILSTLPKPAQEGAPDGEATLPRRTVLSANESCIFGSSSCKITLSPQMAKAIFNRATAADGHHHIVFEIGKKADFLLTADSIDEILDWALEHPSANFSLGLAYNSDLTALLSGLLSKEEGRPDLLDKVARWLCEDSNYRTGFGRIFLAKHTAELEPLLLAPVMESLTSGKTLPPQARTITSHIQISSDDLRTSLIEAARHPRNKKNPTAQQLATNFSLITRQNAPELKQSVNGDRKHAFAVGLKHNARFLELATGTSKKRRRSTSRRNIPRAPATTLKESPKTRRLTLLDRLEDPNHSSTTFRTLKITPRRIKDAMTWVKRYPNTKHAYYLATNSTLVTKDNRIALLVTAMAHPNSAFAAGLVANPNALKTAKQRETFRKWAETSENADTLLAKTFLEGPLEPSAIKFSKHPNAEVEAKPKREPTRRTRVNLLSETPLAADSSREAIDVSFLRANEQLASLTDARSARILELLELPCVKLDITDENLGLELRGEEYDKATYQQANARQELPKRHADPRVVGLNIPDDQREEIVEWLHEKDNVMLSLAFVLGASTQLVTEQNVDQLILLARMYPSSFFASGLGRNPVCIEARWSEHAAWLESDVNADSLLGRSLREWIDIGTPATTPAMSAVDQYPSAVMHRDDAQALVDRVKQHEELSRDGELHVPAFRSEAPLGPPGEPNCSAELQRILKVSSFDAVHQIIGTVDLSNVAENVKLTELIKEEPNNYLAYSLGRNLSLISSSNRKAWLTWAKENKGSSLAGGLGRNPGLVTEKNRAALIEWLEASDERFIELPEPPQPDYHPSALEITFFDHPPRNADSLFGKSLLRLGALKGETIAGEAPPALQMAVQVDYDLITQDEAELCSSLGIIIDEDAIARQEGALQIVNADQVAAWLEQHPEEFDSRVVAAIGRSPSLLTRTNELDLIRLAVQNADTNFAVGLAAQQALINSHRGELETWITSGRNWETGFGRALYKELFGHLPPEQRVTRQITFGEQSRNNYQQLLMSCQLEAEETEVLPHYNLPFIRPDVLLRNALEELTYQQDRAESVSARITPKSERDLERVSPTEEMELTSEVVQLSANPNARLPLKDAERLFSLATVYKDSPLGFALCTHPAMLLARDPYGRSSWNCHVARVMWATSHPNSRLALAFALNPALFTNKNQVALELWAKQYPKTNFGRAILERLNGDQISHLPEELAELSGDSSMYQNLNQDIRELLEVSPAEQSTALQSLALTEVQISKLLELVEQGPNSSLVHLVCSNPTLITEQSRDDWIALAMKYPNTLLASALIANEALLVPPVGEWPELDKWISGNRATVLGRGLAEQREQLATLRAAEQHSSEESGGFEMINRQDEWSDDGSDQDAMMIAEDLGLL